MYKIEQKQDKYLNYNLVDTEENVICTITPEKGGMCTSFIIDGEEMIYINEENYFSDVRTRCAMPVLFPTTGLCEQDILQINGKEYPMGIHGIAHSQKWQVVQTDTTDCAKLTIRLESNEETLKSYPFHFTYDLTYCLKNKAIHITMEIQNHEPIEMPFSFGFHPYFKVSNTNNLDFMISAKSVHDACEAFVPCNEIRFPYAAETKVTLKDVSSPCCFVDKATNHKVCIDFGKDVHYVILWSLCEQNFICMEPWSCLPNGLNKGEGQRIKPNEVYKNEISISFA